MSLAEQSARDLFHFLEVPFPPDLHIHDSTDAVDTPDFREAVARYSRFTQRVSKNLDRAGLDTGFETFYAVLPALLGAAVSEDSALPRSIDPRVEQDLERFLSGSDREYHAYHLNDVALKLLERQLFATVPIVQPSLDLGIGNGYVSNFIFQPGRLSVGSDPLFSSLVKAKQYDTYQNYISLDAARIPFQDETFSTVLMVHSIDHVPDRMAILREMVRVAAPGATIAFTDLSSDVRQMAPFSGLLRGIGFPGLADDAENHYWNFHGESRELYTRADYVERLQSLGLGDISILPFQSPTLSKLSWFLFEAYLATGKYYAGRMHEDKFRNLRETYLQFVRETVLPLVSNDAELCRQAGTGANYFVTARKPGAPGNRATEGVLARMQCPACRSPLPWEPGATEIACSACARTYPVVQGMALLIPFYAEAWRYIRGYSPAFRERVKKSLRRWPLLLGVATALWLAMKRLSGRH